MPGSDVPVVRAGLSESDGRRKSVLREVVAPRTDQSVVFARQSFGNLGSKVHRAWHGFWAIVWSHLRWDSRAAQHIDAWLVLGMDELSLHVMEPNRDRVGCRLVPIDDPDGYYHWLEHGSNG